MRGWTVIAAAVAVLGATGWLHAQEGRGDPDSPAARDAAREALARAKVLAVVVKRWLVRQARHSLTPRDGGRLRRDAASRAQHEARRRRRPRGPVRFVHGRLT